MGTPPYIHRVTKVTLMGHMFGGSEQWTTGFYMGNESADADLPNQQLANDIATAWKAFWISQDSFVSNAYIAETVKVSSYGTDGKANAADTIYANVAGAPAGTKPSYLPPQNSLVATLVSSRARGVGAKGRMYLPGIVVPIDGTGKATTTLTQLIANQLQIFLKACNDSTATNNVVMLASHGSINKDGTPKIGGSAPINKAVISLKVGNVYDTQRRRRNALVEQYVTATL